MAANIEFWIIIITLTTICSLGDCAVDYIKYGHNRSTGWIEEGSSVTISCYFDGNKPPGPSRWTLDGETITSYCTVDTPGKDILTPINCSEDNGNGISNYSFVMHNVSLDRDRNSWVCKNAGLNEPLTLPISVTGKHESHQGKQQYTVNENMMISAKIDCSYPPGKVLWCLDDGTQVKCSNEAHWADGVFVKEPVISQTTEKCIDYTTPGVSKYLSIIQGSITSIANCDMYKLYNTLHGIQYNTNETTIFLTEVEEQCSRVLPVSTMVVFSIYSLLLVVSIGVTFFDFRVLIENHEIKVIHILWIIDMIFFIASLALYIKIVLTCPEWIMSASIFLGIMAFLSTVYFIIFCILPLLMYGCVTEEKSKEYTTNNNKETLLKEASPHKIIPSRTSINANNEILTVNLTNNDSLLKDSNYKNTF